MKKLHTLFLGTALLVFLTCSCSLNDIVTVSTSDSQSSVSVEPNSSTSDSRVSSDNTSSSEITSSSSTTNPYQLEAPLNFRYEERTRVLRWSIVDNASSYVVVVGLNEKSTTTNSISVDEFGVEYGTYQAKVRSVGASPYKSSSYCQEITISYHEEIIDNSDEIKNLGGSMKAEAFRGVPKDELTFFNSVNVNDEYYFWYFDLGTVHDTPIYSSYSYKYEYEGTALDVSFDKITSEIIENNQSESVEVIDTKSRSEHFTLGYEQDVQTKFGAIFAKAKIEFKTSQEFGMNWTQSWGTIKTSSTSVTNSYETTYQYGYSIHIPFSEQNGFKKGYRYRVTFFEPIKTYGVLMYDVEKDEYVVGYDTYFLPNSKACIIEESQDGTFEYSKDKTITFDLDAAKEYAINHIPTNTDSNLKLVKNIGELNTAMLNATSETKIRLLNDIDATNYSWQMPKNFKGELNGNGKKITNLKINKGKVQTNVEGVYGLVEELTGSVRNLKLVNYELYVWKYHDDLLNFYLGGICGVMNSGAEINDVTLSASSIYGYHDNDTDKKNSRAYVGGLVGNMGGGSIYGCCLEAGTAVEGRSRVYRTSGSTADTWCFVGGFVGYLDGGEIKNCKRDLSENTTILSYTLSGGKVSAYHSICGGIIGYQNAGTANEDTHSSFINGVKAEAEPNGSTANTSEKKTGKIIGNLQK